MKRALQALHKIEGYEKHYAFSADGKVYHTSLKPSKQNRYYMQADGEINLISVSTEPQDRPGARFVHLHEDGDLSKPYQICYVDDLLKTLKSKKVK